MPNGSSTYWASALLGMGSLSIQTRRALADDLARMGWVEHLHLQPPCRLVVVLKIDVRRILAFDFESEAAAPVKGVSGSLVINCRGRFLKSSTGSGA
jgi:hypothetical protein